MQLLQLRTLLGLQHLFDLRAFFVAHVIELTVEFFDVDELAGLVNEALDHPDRMKPLRERARETAIRDFDLKRRQLPTWHRLLAKMARGEHNRPATAPEPTRPRFPGGLPAPLP